MIEAVGNVVVGVGIAVVGIVVVVVEEEENAMGDEIAGVNVDVKVEGKAEAVSSELFDDEGMNVETGLKA